MSTPLPENHGYPSEAFGGNIPSDRSALPDEDTLRRLQERIDLVRHGDRPVNISPADFMKQIDTARWEIINGCELLLAALPSLVARVRELEARAATYWTQVQALEDVANNTGAKLRAAESQLASLRSRVEALPVERVGKWLTGPTADASTEYILRSAVLRELEQRHADLRDVIAAEGVVKRAEQLSGPAKEESTNG